MKCPHCLVEVNPSFSHFFLGVDKDGAWAIYKMTCPQEKCGKFILELHNGTANSTLTGLSSKKSKLFVRPIAPSRTPIPPEVDLQFAKDYTEACLVLAYSPKASAALSRRCLQNILREKAGVKKGDLAREIQEVIDKKSLPSFLSESIDAIRNIGNFAAHPVKSTSTGEIAEVEVGEAEWLLDVLEALFDFYFVQPAILQAKRDILNAKLQDMGKPPMK